MIHAFDRRRALLLLAGGAAACASDVVSWTEAAETSARPLLATPEQLADERQMLQLLKDPRLLAMQSRIRADLLVNNPTGRTKDGASTVDRAVALWTNSLVLAELGKYRAAPAFIWGTDDTPRHWHGYEFAVGTSGDNPDAIYRSAIIEGSRRYVIDGQIDRAQPAVQLVIEIDAADLSRPASIMDMSAKTPRVQSATLAILIDSKMQVASDGTFRVTLGGEGSGPNHVELKPGLLTVGTRDILSDWRQRPARLTIREVGPPSPPAFPPLDAVQLRDQMLSDLPDFIKFWAHFPDVWFGGLKPNAHSEPMGRTGGWGFVAGLRFDLKPDEAMVVTTTRGGARYTGFQLNDPWMIQADARRYQVCLNSSQAEWDADGVATYVIAVEDPGVANWLDPAGVSSGLGVLRWQAVPDGAVKDGLIRDVRVVKLSEVATMNLTRVTPARRRQAIKARAAAYESRIL
jgi:hypothetical protein